MRRDRTHATFNKKSRDLRGGGVCIAIRKSNNYKIVHRTDWESRFIEDIWVSLVPLSGNPININCCYIPGTTPSSAYHSFFTSLTDRVLSLPNNEFLFLGDQNTPEFLNDSLSRGDRYNSLVDFVDFCNLSQFNQTPNVLSGNILDLVFANRHILVDSSSDVIVEPDLYHPPLIINFELDVTHKPDKIKVFRNWKTANWRGIKNDLFCVDWDASLPLDDDIDNVLDAFYDITTNILNRHCPLIVKKIKSQPSDPLLSQELKKLLAKKRKVNAKLRQFNRPSDAALYASLQAECDNLLENNRLSQLRTTESDLQSNPSRFWSYINKKKSNGAGVAEYVKLDEVVAESKEDAANLFAKYFSSVYTKDDLSAHSPPQSSSSDNWNHVTITEEDIFTKLNRLNVKKGAGPDGLPPSFFKKCSAALTYPLFVIFSSSLRQGKVPTKLKQSFVVPVHKGGSQNDVCNYRPISKLSILAKILDSIIADELFTRFSHIISTNQHGFFRGRSTTTNLIGFTDQLQRAVENGGQVDVIYTDFSKAFDKVSHNKLLEKLENLGISGKLLLWFGSYLKGRTQRVQIGDALSDVVDVTSSVVQGSHCGPILFSLFINDLADVLGIEFNCFADDVKLFHEVNSNDDCEKLQQNINALSRFSASNGLQLNVDKCFIASYTRRTKRKILFDYNINGITLERKESIRDLGVIFDGKCSFSDHINEIVKKSKRSLGFVIRNSKEFQDPKTIKTLYCAFVRSSLEYASQIWSPSCKTHIQKLEKVQHKFLRFLARKFDNDDARHIDYTYYETKHKLQPLKLRRIISDIKFTIKCFNGSTDSISFHHCFTLAVPARVTRQHQVFRVNWEKSPVGRLMTNYNYYCNDVDFLLHQKCTSAIVEIIIDKFYEYSLD